MATNIDDLKNKVENEGMNEQGRLGASEFNRLVQAVIECQNGVKSISVNSGAEVTPDENGKVDLTIALGDYEQILTLKYGSSEVAGGGTVLSADNNVHIGVQYKESAISQSGQEISYEATGQIVTLSVYSVPAQGEATLLFSRALASVGHSSTEFTDIDLSEYLNDGTQNLQFRITGTINSNAVQKLITVIAANLKLTVPSNASWFVDPINIVAGATESITTGYYVQGVVQKTLHIRFYNLDESGYEEYTASYTESQSSATTIRENTWTDGNGIGFFEHGVHRVEARLSCTVGSTTIYTPWVVNHVVVIADSTDTTPLMAIQNPISQAGNYETVNIFNWTIYKPNISAAGAEVEFVVANNNKTVTYMTQSVGGVTNSSLHTLTGTIEVDSELTSLQASVFAQIDGVDVNGSSDALLTFDVDNSINYSPTSGADFYLNPKLRNNSESNPNRILNSAKNNVEITGCTFTNMSWMDGVDGWTVDKDGYRCLRLLAGSKITIPYNAYSEFIDNDTANKPLCIELDFAVRNITQEDDPFFLMGNGNASNPIGVYMKPTNGAFSPASVSSWLNKDISWQENVRTHVIFDIDPNYVVENNDDTSQVSPYPIIRTFIGGVINRELPLAVTAGYAEVTINNTAGKSIIIGHNYADIDIYGIRVYKKALSEPQVRQNRLSSLPTAAERSSFIAANNITANDIISLAAARARGYNCVVWHGQPVNSRTGNVKRYGYAEIYRYVDGVLDEAHSGILYGVQMKGQGTTAMNYAEWNYQFQDAKNSATVLSPDGKREFVALDGTKTGKFGYRLESGDPLAKKLVGKVNYASSMQSHKEGACNLYNDLYRHCVSETITDFGSGERVCVKEEPFFFFVQQTEGSQDTLKVFQGLSTFGPGKADKPTWGVSDNDLKAGDSILEGSDNNNPLTDMRVPFTDDGEIHYSLDSEAFMYAGKKNLGFDFGCTADLFKDEETITDEMKPWNVGGQSYTQGQEVPTVKQVKLWQPIINFLYLTNVKIAPWEDTLQALNTAAQSSDFDTTKAYWMTAAGSGYAQYDLFRCQYTVSGSTTVRTFVPAGIRLVHGGTSYVNFAALSATRTFYASSDVWSAADGNGDPIPLNMSEIVSAAQTLGGESISVSGSYAKMNQIYKNCLAIIFRYYADQNIYVNKDSVLFHHEFMKLDAGTDNRSKNTYYRFNTELNCMEQNDDDLDTIFKTNNIGYQSKPYYVLEHDTDEGGEAYWEGLSNALNNTIEAAYSDTLVKEVGGVTSIPALDPTDASHLALVNMMNSMFTAMISLVSATDTMPDGSPIPQTVEGCMMKYFFRIQKYFPAVAYNETARIRYEAATVYHDKPTAIYQSLGDQYDSEREYVKRRLIMLIGYARYKLTTGTLQNRGYGGDYEMALVPHFYMFPTALSGASITSGTVTAFNERIAAGATCNWTISTTGDTTFILFQANQYRELGNLRKWPTGKTQNADTTLNVVGERLTKFECYYDPASGQNIEDYMLFRAPQIDISQSTNIEEINVRNCYNLSTFYNGLSNLVRLKSLDCRGTNIKTLQLPQTTSLTTLRLPAGFETLVVRNCPNLTTLSIGDYTGLASIIATNVGFDSQSLIEGAYGYNKDLDENVLQTVTLTDIDWSNCTAAMLRWLLTVKNLNLTGKIHMSASVTGQIPFSLKKALIERFGDVDDKDNALYVEYIQTPIGSVSVTGDGYFDYVGEEKYYDLVPNITSGNDIRSFVWSIVSGSSGIDPEDYIELSDPNGRFRCKQMGTESLKPTVTVQCVVTLVDGTTLTTATFDIRCYFRQAHIGDYVYHDGTWDDRLNTAKSVIGICFYCKQIYENGQPTGRYDRRMVAVADGSSRHWGLRPNGASTGPDGFQSSGTGALTYDLNGVATDPFDVPKLYNITTSGASDTTFANMIDQNNPSPEYDEDDPQRYFKVYDDTTAVGRLNLVQLSAEIKNAVYGNDNMYTAESMVPQGLKDTAAIIAHRNNVLAGTTYDPDPETSGDETTYTAFAPNDTYPSNLAQKILDIRDFAENTLGSPYPTIYSQYLYPAASEAFAYQPMISSKNVLADKFKAHHWYLPSIGELARLCFLARTCYSGASTYEAAAYNMFGDIFLNAVNAGLFTRYAASSYWSSTEYFSGSAWVVYFSSGLVHYGYSKSLSFVVRPVAAF